MNKSLFLTIALLISGSALAATDHYILRDGNHVQHLKISKVGKEINVTADVDFEPTEQDKGKRACSAEIREEAKAVSDTELTVKKHIEGNNQYCTVNITLTPNGAKLEQSKECEYFAAGLCHFNSEGKELVKIK